jgi:hypothetical protein
MESNNGDGSAFILSKDPETVCHSDCESHMTGWE